MTLKNKLDLSKQYAIKQHKGQYRKNNKTPYWHHLQDVVKNLEMMGIKDESILCSGWLHDSIEDTSSDFDDVSKNFGNPCCLHYDVFIIGCKCDDLCTI